LDMNERDELEQELKQAKEKTAQLLAEKSRLQSDIRAAEKRLASVINELAHAQNKQAGLEGEIAYKFKPKVAPLPSAEEMLKQAMAVDTAGRSPNELKRLIGVALAGCVGHGPGGEQPMHIKVQHKYPENTPREEQPTAWQVPEINWQKEKHESSVVDKREERNKAH